MTVRTYRARTMQEALALVRQELGSQAAVLRTREVRTRGLARLWNGGELIEVVASDNVSVPDRLPNPFAAETAWEVPRAAAGLDLTEMDAGRARQNQDVLTASAQVERYLQQGVRPLAAAEARQRGGDARALHVPLVVVQGGIRGVGATTISWWLAQALARQGRRAVWVNADLGDTAAPAAGREQPGSLAEVITARRTVHEVLTRGPGGIQCILHASSSGTSRLTERDGARCLAQLAQLRPHAEVIVADVGCDASVLRVPLCSAAAAVCTVVTPEDEAVLQAYASLKTHRAHLQGAELLTYVNRATTAEAACIAGRIASACRQFLGLESSLAGQPAVDVGQVHPARGEYAPSELDVTAERVWNALAGGAPNRTTTPASTQNL